MSIIIRLWLLYWLPSYSGHASEDRPQTPVNLPAGLDKITGMTPECLGAFIRDEATACRYDSIDRLDPAWSSSAAYVNVKMPQIRERAVARYVAAIRRGED